MGEVHTGQWDGGGSTMQMLETPQVPLAEGWGWYLYGITWSLGQEDKDIAFGCGLDGRGQVQMLTQGGLAAVASAVPLDEFGPDALRARLRDATWLEAMVRGHERVVEAVQRERPILPSKFGCIYASIADVMAALARNHDALLAKLKRLEGCDEWGIRLYADRQVIQRQVGVQNEEVRRMQREMEDARPGRAYFLQRKLNDVLAAATDQAIGDLAEACYASVALCAVACQVSKRSEPSGASNAGAEILRAAFLVARGEVARFVEELRGFAESREGLRCEYSGPWPAYSFAALDEEKKR